MLDHARPDKAALVRAMFSRISRRYDLMNALMTFGMHRRGDRSRLGPRGRPRGRRSTSARAQVTWLLRWRRPAQRGLWRLISPSRCSRQAVSKLRNEPLGSVIRLVAADGLRLPFSDRSFPAPPTGSYCAMSPGSRQLLAELFRVLAPGRSSRLSGADPPAPTRGAFFPSVLRAPGAPPRPPGRRRRRRLPLPAGLGSPIPECDRLAAQIRAAGFAQVSDRRLGFGTVCLHTATKPRS